MDKAVNAGGIERAAAHEQGLDRERLADFGVLQVLAHELPDGAVGAQASKCGYFGQHGRQLVERLVREPGEPCVEKLARVLDERQIAVRVGWLKAANLGQRILDSAAVIEGRAVLIIEAIPGFERYECDVVFALLAKQLEQLVKEERRGDNGRPRVVAKAAAFKHLSASPQTVTAFQESNPVTLGPHSNSGCQSAEA